MYTFHVNCGSLKEKEKEFLDVIQTNQRLIHKVCRLYTDTRDQHDDLFQEIMTQLWIGYRTFNHESKISTWMYRVALYTAITYIKRVMKMRDSIAEITLEYATEIKDFDEPEEEEILWRAIKQLSDQDRALVTMYIEGIGYREMSQVIGISESNVGVRINRIKSKLKKQVEQWSLTN